MGSGPACGRLHIFTKHLAILGTRGSSHQRFYFQVFVFQRTKWCLGLATASIQITDSLSSAGLVLWTAWLVRTLRTRSVPGSVCGCMSVNGCWVLRGPAKNC